jgi:hypothetical protein
VVSVLRAALAIERLPPPTPGVIPATRRRGLLSLLFAAEELSTEPVRERRQRGRGVLATLFAVEELSTEPVRERRQRGRGVLATLFAVEELAAAPVQVRPRRSRWLRWLLGVERLDHPSE